jgi:MerR family transcriptional regulator, copper efflux regulator
MFTLGAMDGLRVSELAGRAGVAPSTVRFYERAGLLSPARRAANGYRVFDESALDELAFIGRAKGIGMSLEDIAGLLVAWPAGECRSLQARLHAFLAGRISQVHEQAAELAMFERQLRAVHDRLSARDPGPERCGKGCSCETGLDPAPGEVTDGPGPWGCTLDRDELATRAGQWRALAAAATSAERTADAVRFVLPADPEVIATVTALCAAETACCGHTRFLLEITAGQIALTAEAPGTPGLLDALFRASAPIPHGKPGQGGRRPAP